MEFLPGRPIRIGFWVVLLISIFAWAPATYPGYWQGLEGFIPVFNIGRLDPIADVATTADLWRGTGGAAFLLAQPFLELGVDPVVAVRLTFVLCFILGGLGMYIWLQPGLGDRAAGVAGALYVLWPPFLVTVYVRGSPSDAWILALLPLTLAAAHAYSNSRSRSAGIAMVIGLLWMWRTQAGLAVFSTLLVLAYVGLAERDRRGLLIVALSGAAGLASLIPLWSIAGPPPVPFAEHFLYAFQLFAAQWEVAPSVPGWQDAYPFQLGFAVLALSVAALWLQWVQPPLDPRWSRIAWFCLASGMLLVLLSLRISAPLWRWSGADRLLTYPWQILLLAGPFLAMWAATVPARLRSLTRLPQWAALIALVLLSSYAYLTTEFTRVEPPRTPAAVVGDENNLVVLEANLQEADGATTETSAVELNVIWQTLHPLDFDYNVFFQAVASGQEQNDNPGAVRVVAQLDTQPKGGERPTTSWQPGEILTDTYRLELPTAPTVTVSAGELEYYFGYYDWRTGERLPVRDPLAGLINDKVVLYGSSLENR
jgi:hypothetical protein